MSIEFLQTEFEKVSYLASLLTARATGLAADDQEFIILRQELLSNDRISSVSQNMSRSSAKRQGGG